MEMNRYTMSEEDKKVLMDYVKHVKDFGYVPTNLAMYAIAALALQALEANRSTQSEGKE